VIVFNKTQQIVAVIQANSDWPITWPSVTWPS